MQYGPQRARYNTSRLGWFDHMCFEDSFFTLLLQRIKKNSGKHAVAYLERGGPGRSPPPWLWHPVASAGVCHHNITK